MRILSLLFMPALGLVYFAGTQHFSWWSIGALWLSCSFLYLTIAYVYKAALGAPEHYTDYFSSELSGKALHSYLLTFAADDMPVYVCTDESGIVLAHDVCTAHYDGRTILLITSDREKR